MNKNVSMEELVPLIREQIANNGKVTFTPRGISMLPMLRNNEDKITLTRAELPLKKYQIALYERTAGKYVLHRVVGVHEDGYLMRGDNQFLTERGIKDSQIIAVVSDFTRKGRRYNCSGSQFKFYSVVWVNTLALRKIFAKIIRAAGKIKRKLLGKFR